MTERKILLKVDILALPTKWRIQLLVFLGGACQTVFAKKRVHAWRQVLVRYHIIHNIFHTCVERPVAYSNVNAPACLTSNSKLSTNDKFFQTIASDMLQDVLSLITSGCLMFYHPCHKIGRIQSPEAVQLCSSILHKMSTAVCRCHPIRTTSWYKVS